MILNGSKQQVKEWGLIRTVDLLSSLKQSSPHSFLYKIIDTNLKVFGVSEVF